MGKQADIQCLIVDDEELARGLIEAHLEQLDGYNVVASCASALQASEILKRHHVDLMFLDIEMPVLKGTEFYRNLAHKPKVIFTTAYRDYAVDGFELDAIDYLLKPIVFSRFFQAIERFDAAHRAKQKSSNQVDEHAANQVRSIAAGEAVGQASHIFVRKDRKQVRVMLSDILYVQSLKDYIKIIMKSETHIVKQAIGQFNDQLGDQFIRVHRSYIVNTKKITAYTTHDVEIDEHEIPIGENYRRSFENAMAKQI